MLAGARGRHGRRGEPPAGAQPSAGQRKPVPSLAGCCGGEATAAARLAAEEVVVSPPASSLPPSAPPARSAQRAGPAPPQRRSPPAGPSPLQQRCGRARRPAERAQRRRSQSPFIVAVAPPPLRPGGGGGVEPAPRSAGPPEGPRALAAPNRPCAQSPESSSPSLALRLCGPLGTGAAAGPLPLRCAGTSPPPPRGGRAARPLLRAPLLAPSEAARCFGGGHRPGGGSKGCDRLDGRAIARAALGPGGAWALRSGGPGEGAPGGTRRGGTAAGAEGRADSAVAAR